MGWFCPDSEIREDLGELLLSESKSGQSELNSVIELLNDCCGAVDDDEQPSFACCMLEQIREGTEYLERRIREKFGMGPLPQPCERCEERAELREFKDEEYGSMMLCADCYKFLSDEEN